MKITHFKENFYQAIDYRYHYLVGFFKDVITIAKYRDARKLAEFEVIEGKTLIRTKNNCKFKVTLDPVFLFGTIEYWKSLNAKFDNQEVIDKKPTNLN